MKYFIIGLVLTTISNMVAAQSDDPCGAPFLTVNAVCTYSQGTLNGSSNTTGVPAPGCANYNGRDVWYRVTVPANGNLRIDSDNINGQFNDGGMAWYSGTCGSLTLIECNDNGSSNASMPRITSSCLTGGSEIYVRFWRNGGGQGNFRICASTFPDGTSNNDVCSNMQPICSGSPISFPALSGGGSAKICDPGNNYGCLTTTPNPTWYYLEILNPGNLAVNISALSDVDFALWGPYNNLTAAKANCGNLPAPIDCSYSTSPVEQANAVNAQATKVYVLLVTNYANLPQTITVGTAGGGSATTNCSIVPLPVELTTFETTKIGRSVQLDWKTESEINNDYFLVERSVDGQVWQAIGMVDGHGTSTSANSYRFTDDKPQLGTVYYRLKQVDFDGMFEYSAVRAVELKSDVEVQIYPQPAKEAVEIVLVNDEIVKLELYNVQGMRMHAPAIINKHTATIDCRGLSGGIYYLSIDAGGTTIQRQLLVN